MNRYFILTHDVSDWRVWKNGGGITTTIRNHLKSEDHKDDWAKICKAEGLKNFDNSSGGLDAAPEDKEPFSLERFRELLIKFIVSDDQVSSAQLGNNIIGLFGTISCSPFIWLNAKSSDGCYSTSHPI